MSDANTHADLLALGLIVRECPWPLADVCPAPRYPFWQVDDDVTGVPVAFGSDRDAATANALRRLAHLAARRKLTVLQLLDQLRSDRHHA
ncbi:hypothetical protein [Thiocystis violascens]|uniref:Uncharacterized protein n=1 Tax=Thiocystis violascens (strain ATCC 17096 / DSM 198 / 6111) TaxID=765911 RepID=I3YGS9_THIV6|nr:hypothetical protein [Thiocystis violascens]AFL76197.1 hypothetical protein Thivi_4394 [Thiocystis violascens DSM 198]